MVLVELKTESLAGLIAGIYCTRYNIHAMVIPQQLWIEVAEKLSEYLQVWDYNIISLEDWIETCLIIYPKAIFDDETLKEIQDTTLYWESNNGNVVLIISMDLKDVMP